MAKKIPYGLTDYVLLMTDINMHPMKRRMKNWAFASPCRSLQRLATGSNAGI